LTNLTAVCLNEDLLALKLELRLRSPLLLDLLFFFLPPFFLRC